jgi:hypothetical protein
MARTKERNSELASSDYGTDLGQIGSNIRRTRSTGFDYSRIMKADADAQTDLIEGIVETLQQAILRYDGVKVKNNSRRPLYPFSAVSPS